MDLSRKGRPRWRRARYLWFNYLALRGPVADWRAVLDASGVHGVLCRAGEAEFAPAAFPETLVADLRRQENPDGVIALKHRWLPYFAHGQGVKIRAGAFTGHPGQVTEEDEQGLITVTLELFNRMIEVGGLQPSELEVVA